jgi:hypothetical protein
LISAISPVYSQGGLEETGRGADVWLGAEIIPATWCNCHKTLAI